MRDLDETVAILRQLRGLGVRVAIDDFGTGYSSLTWLKRSPVHLLTIDQSFVRDMLTDPGALGIVEGVVSIPHGPGLDVVAEGVEDARLLGALRTAGCDLIGGGLGWSPHAPL